MYDKKDFQDMCKYCMLYIIRSVCFSRVYAWTCICMYFRSLLFTYISKSSHHGLVSLNYFKNVLVCDS